MDSSKPPFHSFLAKTSPVLCGVSAVMAYWHVNAMLMYSNRSSSLITAAFGSLRLCEVNMVQTHAHSFPLTSPVVWMAVSLNQDGLMIFALSLFAWQIIHRSHPSYVINLPFCWNCCNPSFIWVVYFATDVWRIHQILKCFLGHVYCRSWKNHLITITPLDGLFSPSKWEAGLSSREREAELSWLWERDRAARCILEFNSPPRGLGAPVTA